MSVSYPGGVLAGDLRPPREPRLTASQRRRLQDLLDAADRELEAVRRCDEQLRRVQEDRLTELRAIGVLEQRRGRRPSLNPLDAPDAERHELERALASHRQRLDRINAFEEETRARRTAAHTRWHATSQIVERVLRAAGFAADPAGARARDRFESEGY